MMPRHFSGISSGTKSFSYWEQPDRRCGVAAERELVFDISPDLAHKLTLGQEARGSRWELPDVGLAVALTIPAARIGRTPAAGGREGRSRGRRY